MQYPNSVPQPENDYDFLFDNDGQSFAAKSNQDNVNAQLNPTNTAATEPSANQSSNISQIAVLDSHSNMQGSASFTDFRQSERMTLASTSDCGSGSCIDHADVGSEQSKDVLSVNAPAVEPPLAQDTDSYDVPNLQNLTAYFKSKMFKTSDQKVGKSQLTSGHLQDLVKKGDYWCLGKMLFIVKKFLNPELSEIYLNSIQYNLSLKRQSITLQRIKFPARQLPTECIKTSIKGLSAERQGYAVQDQTGFYHILKDQNMLLHNLSDFKLLILPIFYLIHGEAYDSGDLSTMSTYYPTVTKSQINIQCQRCKVNKFMTLSLEFMYHSTRQDGDPSDITIGTRGSPCHGLHYFPTHPYLGGPFPVQQQLPTPKLAGTKRTHSEVSNSTDGCETPEEIKNQHVQSIEKRRKLEMKNQKI